MSKPKVFVVGWNRQIEAMFYQAGWEIVSRPYEADLVQFTGGEDVSPSFYDEEPHPNTYSAIGRDREEKKLYKTVKLLDLPTAGICRGGQFLNVMNGGKMYQHVDNHGIGGTHPMFDTRDGTEIDTTSTHHQMMRPGEGAKIVATAGYMTTYREHMAGDSIVKGSLEDEDMEVLYYDDTKTLCHQGHPEFMKSDHESVTYYFDLINEFFGLEG